MSRADPNGTRSPPDGRPDGRAAAWRQDFPDRLAAGRLRRAARLHQVPGPDQPGVRRRPVLDRRRRTSCAGARGQPPIRQIARLDADCRSAARCVFTTPTSTTRACCCAPDEDDFVAYGQKCTHLSCAVVPEPEQKRFHCPCHDGSFDLATGRPLAGPPRRPLPRILLEIRDGALYATGVEVRAV